MESPDLLFRNYGKRIQNKWIASSLSAPLFLGQQHSHQYSGDPIQLITEEPLALFGLQVLVMVCVCCRCCVCCKCGRAVSDSSGDEPYNIPGAKHIPVPVYGKSHQKRIKKQGPLHTKSLAPVVLTSLKSGTPPEQSSPVASDSTRRRRKHKRMDKKSSGGGFFQRWFGGAERTPERGQTVSPPRTMSPNRDENDYATIDRIRYGKRECECFSELL
ncbi:hypothetical protein COOONC_09490 [Cooperia oncophora]